MKARKKNTPPIQNWVAKHAHKFCKAKVEPSKKKTYVRTPKHRNRDFGVSSFQGW